MNENEPQKITINTQTNPALLDRITALEVLMYRLYAENFRAKAKPLDASATFFHKLKEELDAVQLVMTDGSDATPEESLRFKTNVKAHWERAEERITRSLKQM